MDQDALKERLTAAEAESTEEAAARSPLDEALVILEAMTGRKWKWNVEF